MDDYGRHIVTSMPFDRALTVAVEALEKAGFRSIQRLDVTAAIRETLDREVRQYGIITALHPALAFRALRADLDVGAALMVRLAVYELGDGETVVAAEEPLEAPLSSRAWREEQPELVAVATALGDALGRVLAFIQHAAERIAA